ncbi:MAG: cupin domain-containing protein [Euryarchaeota archaeon]|nr:cupin domain-containing protein [Euryarchaeota archaeon]
MSFTSFDEIEEREVIPGFHAKFVHSENLTVVRWRIEKDASMPEHVHEHEQITHVLKGKLRLKVGNETKNLGPGDVAVIQPDLPHSGEALSLCEVIDIFYPVREDYKE